MGVVSRMLVKHTGLCIGLSLSLSHSERSGKVGRISAITGLIPWLAGSNISTMIWSIIALISGVARVHGVISRISRRVAGGRAISWLKSWVAIVARHQWGSWIAGIAG